MIIYSVWDFVYLSMEISQMLPIHSHTQNTTRTTHTYACEHIQHSRQTGIYTETQTDVHTYTYTQKTCMYIHAHTYRHAHTFKDMTSHTETHTHIHTHTHTYTHTHTEIFRDTQAKT